MRQPYGMHRPRRVDGSRRGARASPSVFARNCPCGFQYQSQVRLRAGRAHRLWLREIFRGDRVPRRDEKPSAAARRVCREPGSRLPQSGTAHWADRLSQHGASSMNSGLTPLRERPPNDRQAGDSRSLDQGREQIERHRTRLQPQRPRAALHGRYFREHTREIHRGTGALLLVLFSIPAPGSMHSEATGIRVGV